MTTRIEWHPIASVPKDRYVLLFDPESPRWDGNMEVGRWFGEEDDGCFWSSGGPNGGLEIGGGNEPRQFSHWAELPQDATNGEDVRK
jgi:hypothetical protein